MNRAHLFALVTFLSSPAFAKAPLVLDAVLDPTSATHSYSGDPGEAFVDDVIPCSVDLAQLQGASLSDFSSIAVRFNVAGGSLALANNTSLSAILRTTTDGTCGSSAFTADQRSVASDLAVDGDDIALESSFNDLTSSPQDGLDFEWQASGDAAWAFRSAIEARPSRDGAGSFDHALCECSVDVQWVSFASDGETPADPGALVHLVPQASASPSSSAGAVDAPHLAERTMHAVMAERAPTSPAAALVDEAAGCSSSGASVPVFGAALLALLARRRRCAQ